jgi:hypothetical protein
MRGNHTYHQHVGRHLSARSFTYYYYYYYLLYSPQIHVHRYRVSPVLLLVQEPLFDKQKVCELIILLSSVAY